MIAIERAIDMAHAIDLGVNIFLLDGFKDAAEYIQKNPGKIKRLIESSSVSALEFYLKRYIEGVSEHELKQKIRHILGKVIMIYSPLEQNRWLKKISERTKIPESSLIEELNLLKKKTSKKEELQSQPVLTQDVPLKSRIEKVAMELLILSVMDPPSLSQVSDLKTFLPDKFAIALDYLQGTKTDDKEVEIIGRYAELRASLRFGEVDLDKIPLEVSGLSHELKKEYYKERKEEILSKIKSLEKSGKTEELAKILKEFDEIAKLVNN
jgi:hypothetical protein